MKIEFLYKDDTYKTVIDNLKESLNLTENEITYTPVVQAGLNIFSFQKNGENEETAKTLDGIKNSILESLTTDKLFVITDEISIYFCQRLYPQLANFERCLRKVLYIASVKSNDGDIINLCKKIEELEFAPIYQMLFSDANYVTEAKKIVNSNSPAYSKRDILKKLTDISESTLWDKVFDGKYSYISENFLDIKDGRNKVMHSRNISYAEFSTIKSTLFKSNKLFKEIECDLLEKSYYDYSNIIHAIAEALNRVGKAMADLAANQVTMTLIKKFGELAFEEIENEATVEEIDVIHSDVTNVETGNEVNTIEEKKELCLTN